MALQTLSADRATGPWCSEEEEQRTMMKIYVEEDLEENRTIIADSPGDLDR
jgi:hypothetical protein